jgi:hypothetical protein
VTPVVVTQIRKSIRRMVSNLGETCRAHARHVERSAFLDRHLVARLTEKSLHRPSRAFDLLVNVVLSDAQSCQLLLQTSNSFSAVV